jgi:hypothetical protein
MASDQHAGGAELRAAAGRGRRPVAFPAYANRANRDDSRSPCCRLHAPAQSLGMLALAFTALIAVAALPAASAQQAHPHPRFDTDRPDAKIHPLPKEDGAFHFVIYGDRTGGPREGIKVLEQAVADTNLLGPDFVITVGDLINGYNDDAAWQVQADEYSGVMQKLACPWFPVSGNHDLYYRGPDQARTSHEANFERHFGPLWYAFEHKNCWFLALHSDEGDPQTGNRTFTKAAAQKMSDAQFRWLEGALRKAKGADHVFLFLHHPRWLERHGSADYGDDWNRVHELLKSAGNVSAVFAGHIHRVRYDGKRDGIEYFTLAAVGAYLDAEVPRAGYLHHVNVVTVRKAKLDVATIPVGAVLDPRSISGRTSEDVGRLAEKLAPRQTERVAVTPERELSAQVAFELSNPASRAIEVTALFDCKDPTFTAWPDHQHLAIPPGETRRVMFALHRDARALEKWFALPTLELRVDYLGDGLRVAMPSRVLEIDLDVALPDVAPAEERALVLDGSSCVALDGPKLDLPDGPFTVEGWLRGSDFAGRRGFVNNTESSGFGIFVSDGRPVFTVFLGDKYVNAQTSQRVLQDGVWHHVAGVFDGSEVRLYVDGRAVGRAAGAGKRKGNQLPVFVGADTDGSGKPTSFFTGAIDEVRISRVARYTGDAFAPARRFATDADTVVLLHLDGNEYGPLAPNVAPGRRHGRLQGKVEFSAAGR